MRRLIVILIMLLVSTYPAAAQEWERVETLERGRIDDVIWLPDGSLAVFGARGIWVYEEFAPDTCFVSELDGQKWGVN